MVKGSTIALIAIGGLALLMFMGGRFNPATATGSSAVQNAPAILSYIRQQNLEAISNDRQLAETISHQFPTQSVDEITSIIQYNRHTQTESLFDRWLAAQG